MDTIRPQGPASSSRTRKPSGDPTPSADDTLPARPLREPDDLVGVTVLDPIVVGDGRFTRSRESGRLPGRRRAGR